MKKQYLLLTIRPEYLVDILNGKKTIEIRKYIPKCKLPCEVYIYCSEGKRHHYLCELYDYNNQYRPYYTYEKYTGDGCMPAPLNGKVVAKFILNNISSYEIDMTCYEQNSIYLNNKYIGELQTSKLEFLNLACLLNKDLEKYLTKENGDIINKFYAWHIDNLVIFDKPKQLSDYGIKRAPQKYCYVKGE